MARKIAVGENEGNEVISMGATTESKALRGAIEKHGWSLAEEEQSPSSSLGQLRDALETLSEALEALRRALEALRGELDKSGEWPYGGHQN